MKSLFKWKQKKQQTPPPPPSIIIPSDFNSSFVSKAIIPSHNNSGFVNYNKIKQNKINMNTHYKIGNTNNITTKIKLTKKKANRSVSSIEEKSWDRRERESLEECTFNPVINKKYNVRNQCVDNCRSNNKALVFERLYKDKERYDTRKQIKLIEIEHLESKENTFRPNVNSNNNNCSFSIGNKAYDVSVSNYLTKMKSNNNNK
jgi:hypothetical protein